MRDYIDKNLKALIILDSLQFLSYRQKRVILESVERPCDLFEDLDSAVKLLEEFSKADKMTAYRFAMTENYFEFIRDGYKEVEVLSYLDEDYPTCFKNLVDYPILLYCVGDISLLKSDKILGVAGSRKTLNQVTLFTEKVVSVYENAIVTGNAQGVEMTTLSKGKRVICVLAGGIYKIYPEESVSLVAKVKRDGLVISEYPPYENVSKYSFIARNRLIASLSDYLFVASASFKSGIRHTVNFALEYGKEIFTLPYTIGEVSGEFCNELIKDGANVVTKVEDLLDYFGIKKEEKKIELTPLQQTVYQAIADGNDIIDKIILETKLRPEEVLTALTILELNDLIVKTGADSYTLFGR